MGFTGGTPDKNCYTNTPVSTTPPSFTATLVLIVKTPVFTPTQKNTAVPQPTITELPTATITTAVVVPPLATVTGNSPTVTGGIKKAKSTATPECNEKETVEGCLPHTGLNYFWFLPIGFILIAIIFISRQLRKKIE